MLAQPADAEVLVGFDAVLVGGSAARSDLLEDARRRGVNVVTTYGMSETAGGCVYDGVPLAGVEVSLAPEGRVLLRGPVLFDGYVDRPDLTAAVLRDGWLHTPDLGRFDGSGRLEILGRADDVAVTGGVNVALSAVERRLLDHPAVSQATVLGVPDIKWRDPRIVLAVVVPAGTGEQPDLEGLREFVRATYPRAWAHPARSVVVASLHDARVGQGGQALPAAFLVGRPDGRPWLSGHSDASTSSRCR